MRTKTIAHYAYAILMLPLSIPLAIFAWVSFGIADYVQRRALSMEDYYENIK